MLLTKKIKEDKDGRTAEDRKLSTLGDFKYHHHRVLLQASADERDYVVKVWEDNWQHREQRPKPTTVKKFDNLHGAQQHFEKQMGWMTHYTSLNDLSLFMQQYA